MMTFQKKVLKGGYLSGLDWISRDKKSPSTSAGQRLHE